MRGKVFQVMVLILYLRITPAYAGKSLLEHHQQSETWDHPRLCGEKQSTSSEFYRLKGSPPPMRGKVYAMDVYATLYRDHPRLCGEKHNACQIILSHFRITPAYAGKSFPQNRINIFVKDHPRLCGEKLERIRLYKPDSGSPPPMRGKG